MAGIRKRRAAVVFVALLFGYRGKRLAGRVDGPQVVGRQRLWQDSGPLRRFGEPDYVFYLFHRQIQTIFNIDKAIEWLQDSLLIPDESVGGYVLGIVIPVKEGNEIIGILKVNLNILGSISKIISNNQSTHVGELKLIRSGGLIIFEKVTK